jgi:UDP-N-acetylglucosamine--N-acetylmuramyl-(pentapeptide) pyrophosphoryl-undecaprenol N-acetylglucosamine transferase
MMGEMAPIVLAAGGTGGHMFPAQALAIELMARGRQVAVITERRGAEYLRADTRIAVHVVTAGAPSGGRVADRAHGLAALARGTAQARRLLRAIRPAAVVGFGGYPSLPGMAAALWLGLPTCLHEQNAVLGRVNRRLAPWVDVIAASFPGLPAVFPNLRPSDAAKVTVTGNPVRDAIAAARGLGFPRADAGDDLRLLVFGGSQGARILSEVVPQALALLPPALQRRLQITQQCRPEDMDRVATVYRKSGLRAELTSFIADMPQQLARAHLVISRAGASTTSELAVVGRPAILAPYPHAMDDHQSANARALAEAGAAWILPDRDLTPVTLAKHLQPLLAHPERLAEAAAQAARLGRPDAAGALADLVEHLTAAATSGRPTRRGAPRGWFFARRREAA